MNIMSRTLVSGIVTALLLVPTTGWCQTGTISGTVRVDGAVPPPLALEVDKNQDVCGDTLHADNIIVNNGSLAFAIAYVDGLEGETQPQDYTLSNTGCRFDPPVLAGVAGGTLVVGNNDDVLHNTHLNLRRGTRTRTVGNWALSGKGSTIRAERPLRRPGILEVECDAHSWMHAMIRVFDHPYFAVTSASGSFEIAGVPAGTHTIKMWHEVFGELEQSVTVQAGATATVSFDYDAGKAAMGEGIGQ